MTRADIESRLVKAEGSITLAIGLVRRQNVLLADLKRRGHEATADLARAVLATLEESLRLHIADRDQIMRELDATSVDGDPSLPGFSPSRARTRSNDESGRRRLHRRERRRSGGR
jgi:hypothetical protein